jgi:hypothetical protein
MQKTVDKLHQELELTRLEMNAVNERNKHYQIEIRILKEQLMLRQNIVDLSFDINRLHHHDPPQPPSTSNQSRSSTSRQSFYKDDEDVDKEREMESYIEDLNIDNQMNRQMNDRIQSQITRPSKVRSKSAEYRQTKQKILHEYRPQSAATDRLSHSYDMSQQQQRAIFEDFDKSKKAKVRSRSISPGRHSFAEPRDSVYVAEARLSEHPAVASYDKPPLPKKAQSSSKEVEVVDHASRNILSSSIDSSTGKDSVASSASSTKDKYQKLKLMYDRIHNKKL